MATLGRRGRWGLLGGLALGALWALRPGPPAAGPSARTPERRGASRAVPAADTGPLPAEAVAPSEPGAAPFEARTAEVRERCGLPVQTRCEGGACAGVMTSPDLDRLGGWVRIVWTSPLFVASTIARDLGVPADALPCGAAVDGMVGGGVVLAVELRDGTEIWCTFSGPEDRGRALCSELGAEIAGPDAARFSERGLRQLRF